MKSRLTLYQFGSPAEAGRKWVAANSLATLVAERPDAYEVCDFASAGSRGTRAERSALLVKLAGDPIKHVARVLAQPDVREWISDNLPVVIDDSTEVSLSGIGQWQELRRTVEQAGLPPIRLLWVLQNERGPEHCVRCFADEKRHRVAATVLHYWMHRTRSTTDVAPARPDRQLREKRFLSLNYKLRAHRAAILGWLINEGLLAQGLASLPAQHPGAKHFKWPTVEAFASEASSKFPGFDAEIRSSLSLFDEGLAAGKRSVQVRYVPWDLHARSGFSLVSETEMRDRHTLRFTEKTLKALAAWHPVIVAGNMGTLQLLRDYGFQTFSPWIDESYDQIEAPGERLRAALAEAKRLITLSEDAFDRLLDDLEPVLEHNHRHFMDGLPAIMDRQHAAFQRAVIELSAAG